MYEIQELKQPQQKMAEPHPNRPHAIVFQFPFRGHIAPTINLAINLASRGFTVTYIPTEFIYHEISKAQDPDDLFTGARSSGLDIRCTTISDGFPLEFDRYLNENEYWESMVRDFPARVDELVGSIARRKPSLASAFFLVADSLYSWPAAIAMKHNLVNVSLWTGSATVFSINSLLNLLLPETGHIPLTGSGDDHINCIPGVQSIRRKDLMSYVQDPDVVPVLTKIAVTAFEQVKNADFILCNTVQELESEVLSALNQKQPTYAIGPIDFLSNIPDLKISLRPESDCTQWLNSKPPGSVLYISFGSIAQLNKVEITEIARGLLLSQVNFLWVLRTSEGDDVFPVGSDDDDVRDRGLVVPWCNQRMVLSSQAMGGFVTHCGWNSILESVWSGVPMICYPFFVDQPTNRKLVVDDWKIGINLCDEGQVSEGEFVSKINILMRGKTSVEFRERMKKMSEKLRKAIETDGSSRSNFGQFVEELKARIYARKEEGSKS